MGIRDNSILRYVASLLVIASSLIFILIYAKPAMTSIANPNNYYNAPIYFILIFIYLFAFIEGLLMLLYSKHIGLGISLIIEAIAVLFISSLFSNFVIMVSSLILFISGILIFIYNPKIKELSMYPKQARRYISFGAYIIFFAFIIDIGFKLFATLILQSEMPQGISLNLSGYLSLIIIYLITIVAIFLFALYINFRLRSEDLRQVSKYSKFALYTAIVAAIFIAIIHYGFSFLISNFPILESVFSLSNPYGSIANLSSIIAIPIACALSIGLFLLILGGLSGLAFSKKLSLITYLSVHRKPILYSIIALIIVYIAFSFYSNYTINADNKLALSALNSKIQLYNVNLRYLLANKTAYNDAFGGVNASPSNATYFQERKLYNILLVLSSPQSNISSVFNILNVTSTLPSIQELSKTNWYNYNPVIRIFEINALYSLGILNFGSNIKNSQVLENQQRFIPQKVSPLQSIYELESYGTDILLPAVITAQLFRTGLFNAQNINSTKPPSNTFGVGISTLPCGGGTLAFTSMANGSLYDAISGSSISNSWLGLIYNLKSFDGQDFPGINNSTFINKFFYSLALNQYEYYYSSQIFYNQSIPPNIDFIGYLNDTLIINLGNIGLTNPQISLYIDGSQTPFKRYYNYLIVYNKYLTVGNHTIMADVGNLSLFQSFYISPTILGNLRYLHNGVLSFSIHNPYPAQLNITNISVSGGVVPQPSIVPASLSGLFYNWSSEYTGDVTLANVTYIKFNSYPKMNATSYKIPINTRYIIDRNDSLVLNFTTSPSSVGTNKYYTVTFDTNYGVEHAILCVEAI